MMVVLYRVFNLAALAVALVSPLSAQSPPAASKPTHDYWVYVGAESADLIHRIRFGPAGVTVEKTIPVGELSAEMEGPHGLVISADAKYLHMTTGHGFPDGKYWKYELGADTLVGPGVLLGNFPASIDVTPDGLYTLSANFNLHGDMVPSSMSVVYTPTGTETARIVTCVMPHGSRIDPAGTFSIPLHDGRSAGGDRYPNRSGVPAVLPRQGKGRPLAADDGGTMAHAAGHASGTGPALRSIRPTGIRSGARHAMAPNSCSPRGRSPRPTAEGVRGLNTADEILEVDRAAWSISVDQDRAGSLQYRGDAGGRLLLATLKQGGMSRSSSSSGKSVAQIKNSTTVAHGHRVSRIRAMPSWQRGRGAAPGKVDVYDLHS